MGYTRRRSVVHKVSRAAQPKLLSDLRILPLTVENYERLKHPGRKSMGSHVVRAKARPMTTLDVASKVIEMSRASFTGTVETSPKREIRWPDWSKRNKNQVTVQTA